MANVHNESLLKTVTTLREENGAVRKDLDNLKHQSRDTQFALNMQLEDLKQECKRLQHIPNQEEVKEMLKNQEISLMQAFELEKCKITQNLNQEHMQEKALLESQIGQLKRGVVTTTDETIVDLQAKLSEAESVYKNNVSKSQP